MCRACWDQAQPHLSACCQVCGRFAAGMGSRQLCSECLEAPPPFSMHRSCGPYEGKLKDIVLLYKYQRMKVLGPRLARMIHEVLGQEEALWKDIDLIIPIPLHPRRRRERGFNQAGVMAKSLARLRCIPHCRGLVKIKNVHQQAGLKAKERRANIRGAFRVNRENEVRGKVVLLVDDVYTTGATIQECSLALKKAGVLDVRAVTVAQA